MSMPNITLGLAAGATREDAAHASAGSDGSTHASRLRGRRPEKQDGASSWRMETRDGALESYSL